VRVETVLEKARIESKTRRAPRWVLPVVTAAILTSDMLLAAVCFAVAFVARENAPVFGASHFWSREFAPYAAVLLFAAPIRVATLFYQNVYRLQGAFSYADEAFKIFKAVSIGSLLIIAAAFLFRGGFRFREFSYSRGVFILDFAFALAAYAIFHLSLRFAQKIVRRRKINLIPTLIVGGAEALPTIKELESRPDLGYRIVGVVLSDDCETEFAESAKNSAYALFAEKNVPIVGGIADLASLIKELSAQEVIITDNQVSQNTLFEAMMRIGRKQRVEFRVAPNLFDILPQKTEVEQIGVLPVISLFREPLSDAERVIKRLSDLVIATTVLIMVSPLWLLIVLLIRIDSKGAALFRQERVGMDGRVFLCYKFRTMRQNADENLHREIYKQNIKGKIAPDNSNGALYGKVPNDPRITRVGRFLRRSSLDELPQLLNVLIGDMSVVGARPPIPYEVEEYAAWHRRRLDMKPGITGLWQVSGRNRLTFDEMVKLDLYYIENWSLLFDLKIILLTLPAILRGDGAH
jgi:exopolysaccharide biosynthesis polyprenyl glycosylphosphotransferase